MYVRVFNFLKEYKIASFLFEKEVAGIGATGGNSSKI